MQRINEKQTKNKNFDRGLCRANAHGKGWDGTRQRDPHGKGVAAHGKGWAAHGKGPCTAKGRAQGKGARRTAKAHGKENAHDNDLNAHGKEARTATT